MFLRMPGHLPRWQSRRAPGQAIDRMFEPPGLAIHGRSTGQSSHHPQPKGDPLASAGLKTSANVADRAEGSLIFENRFGMLRDGFLAVAARYNRTAASDKRRESSGQPRGSRQRAQASGRPLRGGLSTYSPSRYLRNLGARCSGLRYNHQHLWGEGDGGAMFDRPVSLGYVSD